MKKQTLLSLLHLTNHSLEISKSRFLKPDDLNKFLTHLSDRFTVSEIGKSVNAYPLYNIKWGTGKTKVLLWSQMHGNESTTTRALVNLLSLMDKHPSLFAEIYQEVQLMIIPMVNPDGSLILNRYNANQVDLNRDAVNLSQPESKILMDCYNFFQPDFCLNLHDQRSIFGVKEKFAGISFLAPSYNASQSVDTIREKSMSLIANTNRFLSQNGLTGNIGRYDETFNKNCFGDYFQSRGSATILIEAGQLQLDFNRNKTVYYSMLSLFNMLELISKNTVHDNLVKDYYNIPMNEKLFTDLLIRNVKINGGIFHLTAKYHISVNEGKVIYKPVIEKISKNLFPCHRLVEADYNPLVDAGQEKIRYVKIGAQLSNLTINSVNFSLF